ncbi:hypothetical protein [Sphingomonas sp. LR55]|jgi:hypothetical protein|uniref:hypothetical protein n=1 Tax=Sphingomonas sp. LR55 TaxID=3050231 RepID=UPI002FE35A55
MVGDLIVMAIAASAGSHTVVPLALEFDLAKVRPKEVTCADRTGSDDVVVCAPKGMDIWLGDVRGFVAKPVRAEFTGPLKAETTLHAIQQTSPVATTPAAAVTFKWRF